MFAKGFLYFFFVYLFHQDTGNPKADLFVCLFTGACKA